MPPVSGEQHVATLWQLALTTNQVSCSVYRRDDQFLLRLESPTATIVCIPFEIRPRAVARAQALRESLKRRGWSELNDADGPPAT